MNTITVSLRKFIARQNALGTLSFWTFAALASHSAWGTYPVFTRYLQTISRVPSLSLNGFANVIVLLFFVILFARRINWQVFRRRSLWLFALIVVLRSTTNLFSTRYTLAMYVQIITMTTPFIIALLGVTLLRERLVPYTGRALMLSVIGTLLMVVGDPFHAGADLALKSSDWLGIGLALASAFFLALYMVLIRRSVQRDISPESLLVMQAGALAVTMTMTSALVGEDWSRWQTLAWGDWAVFAAFVSVTIIAGSVFQMSSLKHLKAAFFSSLMPWRFVITFLLATVMLGERITSAWQALGMFVVFATITWYVWKQNTQSKINHDAPVE
ncbi:MAG: DMT family transporter [Chloroflexi bacterium]|nr:DMT family transporter [Chloroflexota bacterium]